MLDAILTLISQRMTWSSCITYLLMVAAISNTVRASPMEHQLFTDLLRGYNNLVRPVANVSQPVVVTLAVILQQIIDVDEKNEQVTLNCWLQYSWSDNKMHWNPDDYGGISNVRFPYGSLWKPDVLIYNSAADGFDSTYPTNLIVYNEGTVEWIPPGIFEISCKVDITWFPFDEQLCFFKFGSWTYDGTKIDLVAASDGMDLSSYVINGEWDLYKTLAVRSEKFYDCCPEPYPDIRFQMFMKRRTLYFGVNLITPCLIITLLTILGFALPSDGCQKVTLQITIMLAICFFLDVVAKMSPPTSEAVPLLGVFFSTCTVLSAASVAMTVAVLNIHHRHPDFYQMGYKTRVLLIYWLPWFVAMERPGKPLKLHTLPSLFPKSKKEEERVKSPWYRGCCGVARKKPESTISNVGSFEQLMTENDPDRIDARINECYVQLSQRKHEIDTYTQNAVVLMHMAYTHVKKMTKSMQSADTDSELKNEWTFAAMAIDRLCCYMLAALISASTCFIFFKAPYLTVPIESSGDHH